MTCVYDHIMAPTSGNQNQNHQQRRPRGPRGFKKKNSGPGNNNVKFNNVNVSTGYKSKKSKSFCEVCKTNISKYEVPKAKIFYCSVACYKQISDEFKNERIKKMAELEEKRRNNLPAPSEEEARQRYERILGKIPDQDTVPEELLDFLKADVALRNLLKNKALRRCLEEITKKGNLEKRCELVERLLKDSASFREYANAVLNVIEPDLLDN